MIPVKLTSDADSRVMVELDKEWVPNPNRIGGMSEHLLRIKIDGVWYTEFTERDHTHQAGERYVDGDTLCQYLAWEIDADKVIAAATAVEEEIAAQEHVPILMKRIENLEKQVKGLTESLRAERSDRSKEQQEMSILGYTLRNTQLEVKRLGDISTWYRELKSASDVLMKTAVTSPFYAIERLRRACCIVSNRVDAFPQENLVGAPHQD